MASGSADVCRHCGEALDDSGWCTPCQRGARLRADDWASLLLDTAGEEIAADRHSGDPLGWPGYAEMREETPGAEAVRVWAGRVGGHGVVLIAFDFRHLGGSAGAGVGERVVAGFETATERRLPVVIVTATGGSRMQEGMVALSQMPRMTVASRAHADAGLLQLGVASDPTTGGVYASVLSQVDVLVAEPGAYVGFAGPRVAAALAGAAPAEDVNRAEFAFEHGLVDAVVDRPSLRAWIAHALAVTAPRSANAASPIPPVRPEVDPVSAWEAVEAARNAQRPRASSLIAQLGDVLRLHGDRCGGTDPGVIAALGRLDGRAVAVVGLDRHAVQPGGYRAAWRLFELAERLGISVITLVDTPGADPSPTAEAAGQAHAISHTLVRLLRLSVPTVAVVTGEGGSGGAIALAAADRLLIQQRAIFSVIAPEGAAAILHRDAKLAPEVAEQLRLTAADLVELGIADGVIADDPRAVFAAAAHHLGELAAMDDDERMARRRHRWATVGADKVQKL